VKHAWLDRPPPRTPRIEAVEPFPDFNGAIGMRELGHARKLLGQGLSLDRVAMLRIVDRAIELQVRDHFKHDDSCTWWFGADCDCGPGKDATP
jgi:hypothetical protein